MSRSKPAENARPAPATTIARTASSASAASSAASSASMTGTLIAFSLSGRLSVRSATAPRRSDTDERLGHAQPSLSRNQADFDCV